MERRGRSLSPKPHTDTPRSRDQSPSGSFYHDHAQGRVTNSDHQNIYESYIHRQFAVIVRSSRSAPTESVAYERRNGYTHSPITSTEIRLLRIEPGSYESDFRCSLKIVTLESLVIKIHDFQALSYAWGQGPANHCVLLNDLPRSGDEPGTVDSTRRTYYVRNNLHYALKAVRDAEDSTWVWCDALCIDQTNEREKSQQIPMMPRIFSSAWNVIAWLGSGLPKGREVNWAIDLIPILLNLKMLDCILRQDTADEEILVAWACFGRLIKRPWFRRRWIIQEVACARRLAVRVADRIVSWQDFSDAVDFYLTNNHRMRMLYRRSTLYPIMPTALDGIEDSEAATLMRLSRNIFRKTPDMAIMSREMNLESLVLVASSFAVSNVRDTVYSLLFLANNVHKPDVDPLMMSAPLVFVPDYTKPSALILLQFARYCIATSKSLDIICRPWARWPCPTRYDPYEGKILPTWIGVASFGKDGDYQRLVSEDSLLGPVGARAYDACGGVPIPAPLMPPQVSYVLRTEGVILGRVEAMSKTMDGNTLDHHCLQMLGWDGKLDEGLDDRLWRSLVANRDPYGNTAPTLYRRACALALTSIDNDGDLDLADLVADQSQPSALIKYLRRVQAATQNRRVFHCAKPVAKTNTVSNQRQTSDILVGLGPQHMGLHESYWICILFGCSVPVMLTQSQLVKGDASHAFLVGACYVHGNMEGEMFVGMSKEDIQRRSGPFNIH